MQDIVGGLEHLARTYHVRGSGHVAFSTPPVSSTASVADEDEAKADREPVFVVGPSTESVTKVKVTEILPTPAVEDIQPETKETEVTAVEAPSEPETIVVQPEVRDDTNEVASTPSPAKESLALAPAEPSMKTVVTRWLFGSSEEAEATRDYYARTASALLAGFFTGALVTLCVVTQHRREISNHFS
ncbi:hypothetical protein C8Q73DRAFT_674963 [Cubamyces lactineus]|nr:hypothetical protein C8Q73DRAFT_674963 [Cubamyces lactineus]